ncbi:hypothetical protein RI685_16180 (plasmid) [Clavibacter michiganensis]|uniref:hypothetical protein n=1 Tax=Clavibacter michiganensis TaxID=28447 RepID=UPI003DA199AF
MSTIDRTPAELADALTFGVDGYDAAAHAARATAAQAALSRHSDELDHAYASVTGVRDPWTAAPFGAELVAAAGGDLSAVLASTGFVPEVQREMGLASREVLVNDEDGARYVWFRPTAADVDVSYDAAHAIADELIQNGNARPTAHVGAGRGVDGALLLTRQQRETLVAAARDLTRGDDAGRFKVVAYYLEQQSQLPNLDRMRRSLELVAERHPGIRADHAEPEHLRDVFADLAREATRDDFLERESADTATFAASDLDKAPTQTPGGYSRRELADRELLSAAGIDPDERTPQPTHPPLTTNPPADTWRTRGDDPRER